MNGVKARKHDGEGVNGGPRKPNGYANLEGKDMTPTEQSENVFLFYPNIIGTLSEPSFSLVPRLTGL